MVKTGRNEPCPCGSNKKYKHCCLAKDQAAEHDAVKAARSRRDQTAERDTAKAARSPSFGINNFLKALAAALPKELIELEEAFNVVVDLIDAGKLDEAEHAAHALVERFPDVHDGYDCLARVCEARGGNRKAAEYYRKVIEFAREHPDQYDAEFEAAFQELVDKLDPSSVEPAP